MKPILRARELAQFCTRGRKSLLECALAPVDEAILISVPPQAVRMAQAGNTGALYEALGPRQEFRSATHATLGQLDGHEYVFVFHGFRDSQESTPLELEYIALMNRKRAALKAKDEAALDEVTQAFRDFHAKHPEGP